MNDELLFHEALERPAHERAAFLDQACAGDQAQRRRVEALVQAHDNPGSFLQAPAVRLPATTDSDPQASALVADGPAPSETSGRVIGHYQLLQQIGEGGFGLVFLAEQQQPVRRQVALKLIKAGMDSRHVIARFEAERQALALMDHPHIARVYDAGETADGRPYFVMELVQGVPITQFCDAHRLPPRARLELFATVCQAVQHAHHKGIIHRDIKPSNVLVTLQDDKPVVKVIDFGIAKATGPQLADLTQFTQIDQVVGTPLYMSPEQAGLSGLDIDTRSDIYSLGVLLYELLTGTTPFDRARLKQAALEEIRRIIREEEPPRPSTRLSGSASLPSVAAQRQTDPKRLRQMFRGEVDWIVMKALEKDRNRRYESANGLARDIERYLADEPVQACPPSAGYRLRKFVRRNKRAVATAVLLGVMLLVVLGTVAGSIGWVMRDHEARQAKMALDMQLALERAELFQNQGKRAEALAAFERAELLGAEPALDPALRQRLAAVKERLDAEAQDQDFVAQFEKIRLLEQAHMDDKEARFTLEEASLSIKKILRAYGIEVGALAPSKAVARIQGRPEAVQAHLLAALHEFLIYTPTKDAPTRAWLNAVLNAADTNPWQVHVRKAEAANDGRALAQLAQEVDVRQHPPSFLLWVAKKLGSRPVGVDLLRRIQRAYPGDYWANTQLAWALRSGGQPAEAVRYFTAAVALSPRNAAAYYSRAGALKSAGELEAAIVDESQVVAFDPSLSSAQYNLGLYLIAKGDLHGAIAQYYKANAINPEGVKGHYFLGSALLATGDVKGAIAAYRKAVALGSFRVDEAYSGLGDALLANKDIAGAIAAYRKAIALNPNSAEAYFNLAMALKAKGDGHGVSTVLHQVRALGNDLKARGNAAGAVAAFQKAIALDPNDAIVHYNLANVLRDKGQLDEASAAFQQAIHLDPQYAEAHCDLGEVLLLQVRYAEGLAARRRGHELGSQNPAWRYPSAHWVQAAERLVELERRLPALLKGEAAPADSAERLEFARVCQRKHYHAAAAGLYAEALAPQPEAAAQMPSTERYEAACAAALAGSGQGQEAALDATARARWRHQALDWLRAELAAWTAHGQSKPPASWAEVQQTLQRWQRDPHLAGLRENQPLAQWPDAERLACYQFWADVAQMVLAADRATDRRAAEEKTARENCHGYLDVVMQRGFGYYRKGQWAEALAAFTQVTEMAPKYAPPWTSRGNVLNNLFRYQEAVASYSQALAINSCAPEYWHGRALSNLYFKQWDKAIADCSQAIELNSKRPHYWYCRGDAHAGKEEWDKALADYSEALKRPESTNHLPAWVKRADLHARLGRWDQALADYTAAIKHNPKYTLAARNSLAWLLANCPEVSLRDPLRAVQVAREAIELSPQSGTFWTTLGAAHYRAGDWKAALETLTKKNSPPAGWFFVAMAQAKLGDKVEARKKYDQAVMWLEKYRPNDEEQRRFRAEAAAVLGLAKVTEERLDGGTQKPAAVAAPLPSSVSGPFVVLANAGRAEWSRATLAEAVAGARNGDIIEIRGNGPFISPSLPPIKGRALTIRAGADSRPVLRWEEAPTGKAYSFLATDSDLVLEGLEFQGFAATTPAYLKGAGVALVESRSPVGFVHVANCRFRLLLNVNSPGSMCGIRAGGPTCVVRNCAFVGAKGSPVELRNRASKKSQQHVMDNCVSATPTLLTWWSHQPGQPSRARLTHNTFTGGTAFFTVCCMGIAGPEAGQADKPYCLEASGNLLDSTCLFQIGYSAGNQAAMAERAKVQTRADAEALLRGMHDWQDQGNVYGTATNLYSIYGASNRSFNSWKNSTTWPSVWGTAAANSQQGAVLYQGGNLRLRAQYRPEEITAADFRLKTGSAGQGAGPGGRDFGADVDLVGPGPAYERWKKTPAYQQWLKETRP